MEGNGHGRNIGSLHEDKEELHESLTMQQTRVDEVDEENFGKFGARTNLLVLNMHERFAINESVDEAKEATAAILFETINTDNCLAERNPIVCLNVVELRLALSMRFLDFTDRTDRL